MDIVSKSILRVTKDIDFRCDFIDGFCVGRRRRLERKLKDIGKICCRGCFHNVGYFRVKADKLPSNYQRYFIHPHGFWRDGGCILPQKMRSTRCIIYTCRDSNISQKDRNVLLELEGSH